MSKKKRQRKATCGIQIIHDRGNHWVVAYLQGKGESVEVYNSVYSTVHEGTARVITILFNIQDGAQIHQKMMQRQIGFHDCGLFAIAVSTLLLHSPAIDVSSATFCQQQMRDHRSTCLLLTLSPHFLQLIECNMHPCTLTFTIDIEIHCQTI